MTHRRMNATEWLLLLTLSVLWGGSFFFGGVAVRELPPFTIVALRVALAAAILAVAVRAAGLSLPRERRVWLAFLGMGLLNNAIPFSLIILGQTRIASGLASILNATTPLFTVAVAHWLAAEPITRPRLAGIGLGFLGVLVLVGPAAFIGLDGTVLAQAACLAAALSYAFAGVYGRRFRALGVPPLITAAGQVIASSAMLVPLALLVDRPWTLPWPSAAATGAILGLAALSTALAYILYFRLLASAGATNLLLVTFLIPVSALILGATVLGERLEARHLLGMALIGGGLAAIDGRLGRRLAGGRRSAPSPSGVVPGPRSGARNP